MNNEGGCSPDVMVGESKRNPRDWLTGRDLGTVVQLKVWFPGYGLVREVGKGSRSRWNPHERKAGCIFSTTE